MAHGQQTKVGQHTQARDEDFWAKGVKNTRPLGRQVLLALNHNVNDQVLGVSCDRPFSFFTLLSLSSQITYLSSDEYITGVALTPLKKTCPSFHFKTRL